MAYILVSFFVPLLSVTSLCITPPCSKCSLWRSGNNMWFFTGHLSFVHGIRDFWKKTPIKNRNWFWPSDDLGRHRSGSTLARVVDCPMAPTITRMNVGLHPLRTWLTTVGILCAEKFAYVVKLLLRCQLCTHVCVYFSWSITSIHLLIHLSGSHVVLSR